MKPQVLGQFFDLVMYIMTLGVVHPNTATLLQDLVSSNDKTVCDCKQAGFCAYSRLPPCMAGNTKARCGCSKSVSEGEREEFELSRMLLAED